MLYVSCGRRWISDEGERSGKTRRGDSKSRAGGNDLSATVAERVIHELYSDTAQAPHATLSDRE
jgi:hypothetical protein